MTFDAFILATPAYAVGVWGDVRHEGALAAYLFGGLPGGFIGFLAMLLLNPQDPDSAATYVAVGGFIVAFIFALISINSD